MLGLVFIPTIALADYKSEIITSCSEYQLGKDKSEINACKLYIEGFIDSSLLTKDAVVLTKAILNSQPIDQSDFFKRAYKNRVSRTVMPRKHPEYQFCLPPEQDRKAIISNVAKLMDISKLMSNTLQEVLLKALIDVLPCAKKS